MREILFRGKRNDNGEWIIGGYYHGEVYNLDEIDIHYIIPCCDLYDEDLELVEVIPETVGQYTGLKDKNGVRVFEGDIVKALTRYGTEHQYDITYRAGTFWFGGWNWIEFLDRFQFPEVIGNVHDNPELLKGE